MFLVMFAVQEAPRRFRRLRRACEETRPTMFSLWPLDRLRLIQ